MLRFGQIFRYTRTFSKSLTTSRFVNPQISLSCHRYYCKGPNDPDKIKNAQDSCRKDEEAKERLNLKEMKVISIDPCNPPPAPPKPIDTGKTVCERIPPKKKEPPPEKPPKKSNLGKWLLGILVTAAAIGAYLVLTDERPASKFSPPKKRRKRREVPKDPPDSKDIPNNVPYLLVGGGVGSFSAFRAIKSANPTARVLMIGDECYFPYMRPPLSKEMWFVDEKKALEKFNYRQWNGEKRNLYFEPQEFYTPCKELMKNPNGGVAVARGYSVKHIDVINKVAYLDDGYAINYDKCLIATGATPKTLPILQVATQDPEVDERVMLYRSIYDFFDVYDAFEESRVIAIIGGGLLGSELACSLARKAQNRREILQIYRESGVLAKILPEYLSQWTTEKMKSQGVKVLDNVEVKNMKYKEEKLLLTLTDDKEIAVDFAVVAVGVEPNTQLAEKSDLEVDPELGGFVVNTELQARTDLYAAGDCACFYDTQLGRRRIEHFDQAVVTGRLAGENMTGSPKPYTHQGMFWSDIGTDIGFEAIGVVDSSLPTVGVFVKKDPKETSIIADRGSDAKGDCGEGTPVMREEFEKAHDAEDYSKGVVFYLRNDIVVGIVLWNLFNRMSVARRVIKDGKKYDDLNEVAKLFYIHEN